MDAAVLLPFVAALLFALPALKGTGLRTAEGLVYLMGVWLLLIAAALLLSRRLRAEPERETREPPAPPGAGGPIGDARAAGSGSGLRRALDRGSPGAG